jgi:hypothetical protein
MIRQNEQFKECLKQYFYEIHSLLNASAVTLIEKK